MVAREVKLGNIGIFAQFQYKIPYLFNSELIWGENTHIKLYYIQGSCGSRDGASRP